MNRVERARANLSAAGLAVLVDVREGDALAGGPYLSVPFAEDVELSIKL
jgi:hypothetical protein